MRTIVVRSDAKTELTQTTAPSTKVNDTSNVTLSPLWAQTTLPTQASLKINAPGDKYEQEADRVADQVMRMPDQQIQRKTCSCGKPAGSDGMCTECKNRELGIQRMASGGIPQTTAPPIVHQVLQQPGRPLDGGTRNFMESRFGQDFGHVRVHTDRRTAESSSAVNARAYTVGNHLAFGYGQYAPTTFQGRHLLAHELSHTIQQSSARTPGVQRDLAIEPAVANPTIRGMTEEDIQIAIDFNQRHFEDPYSLAIIRDVIGISRFPAVSDRDLALATARWQADHGISQDGRIGLVTVTFVIEELQAEGNDADAALIMLEFPRGSFLDIDTSFCQCRQDLQDEISEANFFISEYQACGADPLNTTGDQIENCIKQRAQARGQTLITAGTTSSSGQINVTSTPGSCGPLIDRITTAHEQIHAIHTRELQQIHGRGTSAFDQAFNDANDWVTDEVNSRHTDIAVSQWAIGILDRICP